jgi:hypothetical protein
MAAEAGLDDWLLQQDADPGRRDERRGGTNDSIAMGALPAVIPAGLATRYPISNYDGDPSQVEQCKSG